VLTFTIIRNAHILKSGGNQSPAASQKYALRTYEMIDPICTQVNTYVRIRLMFLCAQFYAGISH